MLIKYFLLNISIYQIGDLKFFFLVKEWAQLQEQQKETEEKLQELEASPPSDVSGFYKFKLSLV